MLDFLRYIRAGYKGEEFDTSSSSYLQQIDKAVNEIKQDSGREMEYMTLAMKMMDERKEAFEQGQAEGERASQIKTIKRMLSRDMSLEEISDMIGLDLEEVKRLAEKK